MDYLDDRSVHIRNPTGFRVPSTPVSEIVMEKTRLSAYLNFICWMISLENLWVSALNFLFWNIIIYSFYSLNLNAISTISLIVLSLLTVDCICDIMNLEEYPLYISEQEIMRKFNSLKRCFLHTRVEIPLLFYTILSATFTAILLGGHTMSGISVTYTLFLLMFFSKFIIKFMPKQIKQNVCIFMNHINNIEGVIEETDLLPYDINDPNEDVDTDLESLLTDRTQESANNSLASGLSAMPSHLDEDNVQDDTIQEDDLLPGDKANDSSDSDSSERGIFDSYTNKLSSDSSEDENSYSRGLKFADAATVSKKVLEQLGTIEQGSALLKHVLSGIKPNIVRPDILNRENETDSSDSDFEMINTDDIDDENKHSK